MKFISVVSLMALAGSAHPMAAQASYIINIDQIEVAKSPSNFLGSDVIASGSGSLNILGLTLETKNDRNLQEIYGPDASVHLGSDLNSTYMGASGPSTFGYSCGCTLATANFASGPATGISAARSHLLGFPVPDEVFVPRGYISGSELGFSFSVFENETLNDLALLPGSYVYTWAGDTLTVNIGQGLAAFPSTVPLPASAPMFGAALLALGAIGYGIRRGKPLLRHRLPAQRHWTIANRMLVPLFRLVHSRILADQTRLHSDADCQTSYSFRDCTRPVACAACTGGSRHGSTSGACACGA